MINFNCPSCSTRCLVRDDFRGRKLRCPKCRARLMHHLDGTVEILSLGEGARSDILPNPFKKLTESGNGEETFEIDTFDPPAQP